VFALIATACSGDGGTRRAAGAAGDPSALPALAGGTAAGPIAPSYAGAIVTPESWVGTSATPVLSVPDGSGAWRFTLTDLSDGKSSFGTKVYDSAGTSVRVPAAAELRQGNVYTWRAESPGSDPVGGTFTVDVQMNDVQEVDASGGVSVSLSSGEAVVSWSSHSMSSLAGPVGFGLRFQGSNLAQKGVPAGWDLQGATSSAFVSVVERADGSVGLVGTSGMVSNYREVGAEYTPVQLSGSDLNTNGLAPVLLHNADGSWSVTSKTATSYFGVPDADGVSNLTNVASNDKPTLSQTWVDGVLKSITDPVSGRSVEFVRGGGSCPTPAPGFVAAPSGMVCAVKFWDGSTSAVMYVTTPAGGPSIGRIIDYAGAGGDAEVFDFAYDAAGRIAATRTPRVASAAAAGVISADDAQFLTAVTYDENGRVDTITDLAAAPGAVRCVRSYDYESTQFTSVSDSCAKKVISQVLFDPSTFFTRQLTNASGQVMTNEWDYRTGQLLRSVSYAGLVTTNTYENGQLIETHGPTKASLAAAQITRRSYDQEFTRSPDGTEMHGLDVTYWPSTADASAGGVQELGPRRDGGLVPSLLVNWGASPAGDDGGWSALMTGALRVDTAGTYSFASSKEEARLRVNNLLCVDSACDALELQPGLQQIRVDLNTPDAAASMELTWSGPDSGGVAEPIPTSRLVPEYGFVTTTKSIDPTAVASPSETSTRSTYADPSSGELTSRVNQGGSVTRLGYEPVKSGSAWGRQDSATQPGGNSYRLTYWGNTESAKAPCPGARAANQGGTSRSTVTPGPDGGDGPTATRWVDAAGRVVGSQLTDGATTCTTYDAVGRIVASETRGLGHIARTSTVFAVEGNPLISETTETIGDTSLVTRTEIDLMGRIVRTVDPYGIVVTTVYDTVTSSPAQITTTVPGLAPSVMTFTYDGGGRVVSTALGGRVLASTVYNEDGTVRSNTYGNGVTSQLSFDQSNRLIGSDWTGPAGATWSNTRTISAAGNISSATFAALGRSSTFDYVHDQNGRMSSATLTAGLAASSKSWAYTFDQNSNRTSQTIGTDGATTGAYSYSYNGADQLVASDDPAVAGGITYDSRGNATGVGPDSFTYDAANNLISSTDGTTTVTYERTASGGIVSKTTTGTSNPGTVKYAAGGVTLSGDNTPLVQEFPLPGGVTFTRQLTAPGATTWSFAGLNGSKFFVTDDSGTAIGAPQIYDPFGTALTVPVPTVDGASQATWQGVAGNETEPLATPYVMMGARVYVPALGRFLQLDPKIGGSANAYDYANQDPVNLSDPSGESVVDWIILAVVAVATIAASLLLPPATGIIDGVVVGAIIGGIGYLANYAIQNAVSGYKTQFSLAQLGVAMLCGAVLGGISSRVRWARAQRGNEEADAAGGAAPSVSSEPPPAVQARYAVRLEDPPPPPPPPYRLSMLGDSPDPVGSIYSKVESNLARNSGIDGTYNYVEIHVDGSFIVNNETKQLDNLFNDLLKGKFERTRSLNLRPE
jgi:RHS repeat-associated protein